MKKTLMLATFVAFPTLAQVGGYVESETSVRSGSAVTQVNIYAHGKIHGQIGWSAWSLTSKGWSEAYAGPTWDPTSWLEISASVGMETDKSPLRYSGSIWAGKGRWNALTFQETGGSGWWQKSTLTYDVTRTRRKDEYAPTSRIGLFSQRFVGIGPYVEKNLATGRLTIWASPLVQRGPAPLAVLCGLRLNFTH